MTDVFDDDFAGLPELRCSMARQITVMAGALSAAGLAGFGVTLLILRKVLHW